MRDQSIAQVSIEKKTHTLLDHYERSFREKFGENPSVEEDDRIVARWLVQQYDMEKARDFTDRYLTFPNQWIAEQGYPLRLMRKNINAIIVSMPKKKLASQHHKIQSYVYCDVSGCSNRFERVVEMNHNWDEPNECPGCVSEKGSKIDEELI